MKNFTLILQAALALILIPFASHAQVTQSWVQRYAATNHNDHPSAMVTDGSANVYITGSTAWAQGGDIMTLKYNSAGTLIWQQFFNGPGSGSDDGRAIRVDGSGNVYVAGTASTNVNGSTGSFIIVLKYSSTGGLLWQSSYDIPGTISEQPNEMVIDASGNLYITGFTVPTDFTYDALTIKMNSSGALIWAQTYNGTANGYDAAIDIKLDGSGNAYVLAASYGKGAKGGPLSGQDYATLKYGTDGSLLWSARYTSAGQNNDQPKKLALDASANVYVTGTAYSTATGYDYLTVKYSTDGVQLWTALYADNGTSTDVATGLVVDFSGNIVITGTCYWTSTRSDMLTLKYNSSGALVWGARYVNVAATGPILLTQDTQGNLYVAGSGTVNGVYANYVTIKYTSGGAQQWLMSYNGPGNGSDQPSAIATYTSPIIFNGGATVYVTGMSAGSGTAGDFATVKYTQPTQIGGIGVIKGAVAAGAADAEPQRTTFQLSGYPNPFKGATNIQYYLPRESQVSVKIFDIAGREVANLVQARQSAGSYSQPFYSGKLSKGIYRCQMVAVSAAGEFKKGVQLVLEK